MHKEKISLWTLVYTLSVCHARRVQVSAGHVHIDPCARSQISPKSVDSSYRSSAERLRPSSVSAHSAFVPPKMRRETPRVSGTTGLFTSRSVSMNVADEDDSEEDVVHLDEKQMEEQLATIAKIEQRVAKDARLNYGYHNFEPKMSREEHAKTLPDWAAEISLDEEANGEYEDELLRESNEKLDRVVGRTWEDFEIALEEDEHIGLGHFTAEETAEDYRFPIDFVLQTIYKTGVPQASIEENRPLNHFCSRQQLDEILSELHGHDPIEVTEAYVDQTIAEMAQDIVPPITPAQILRLCGTLNITTLRGEETCLQGEDYEEIMRLVDEEYEDLKSKRRVQATGGQWKLEGSGKNW